jgi:hypothetical protein
MPSDQHEHLVIRNRAMCPPACRMLVVSGWVDDDGEGQIFCPVVAVESCSVDVYSSGSDLPPAPNMDYQTLHENGFHYKWTNENQYVLFVLHGYLVSTSAPDDLELEDYEVVTCTWPPEEDEARLAEKLKGFKERSRLRDEAWKLGEAAKANGKIKST